MRPSDEAYVAAGSLDQPTALHLVEHIYVGSNSDFYYVTDHLPQKQEWGRQKNVKKSGAGAKEAWMPLACPRGALGVSVAALPPAQAAGLVPSRARSSR